MFLSRSRKTTLKIKRKDPLMHLFFFLGLRGLALAVCLALFNHPARSQPQQAIPSRSFFPGQQIDSPVPINRGDDTLGLEGFLDSSGQYAPKNRLMNVDSTDQKSGLDDNLQSAFGYELKSGDEELAFPDSDSSPLGNELNGIQEDEGQSRSVMEFGIDVFGIESSEACADLSQAQFCNAFN